MQRRKIKEEWVAATLRAPDASHVADDGTVHYVKVIAEHGLTPLRVIVNPSGRPPADRHAVL